VKFYGKERPGEPTWVVGVIGDIAGEGELGALVVAEMSLQDFANRQAAHDPRQ
jgi:hypothetical protein